MPTARKTRKPSTKVPSRSTRARKTATRTEENGAPSEPGGTLVVVESPAKARTISKYLGRGYKVQATVGHVRDLPEKKIGIDIENGFEPEYVTIPGKEKTLQELKAAARQSREILLATDPDREGEAIAWHVASQIKTRNGAPIRRVLFHEITKDAVQGALENAGEIDERKVDAQQARRVLDRLVGYKASPVLWKTVKKGISAGRVQTVALRLIVDRERDIKGFTSTEYWTIRALLEKDGQEFTARLHLVDGRKPVISNEADARAIVTAVERVRSFEVSDVKRRERRKNPAPPFTTSTLQQEAAKRLGFGSKRTMRLAQDLYEGVELGSEGSVGLITYMRTDSTRVSEIAATRAQEHIRDAFGSEFVAPRVNLYGDGKKTTQDAHEAIRPTDPNRTPMQVSRYLKPDQLKLYDLIWTRFIASQMAAALFDTTTADFDLDAANPGAALPYLFRATGSVTRFPGYLRLYREAREEGDGHGKALEDEQALPPLAAGERVPLKRVTPSQHFTEPPPRYSEASLVKELERLGIGRPSTYASIISTLLDRRYVQLEQKRFHPTELGQQVERVMVKSLPDVFNVQFTSHMENDLDKIEEGEVNWRRMLQDFYGPFAASLQDADLTALIAEAHDLSAIANERCPEDGGRLVARAGFFGPFIACENHPKQCKYTRPLRGERKAAEMTSEMCHECGSPMVIRHGRSGDFLGCSRFPKCRGTRSMPTGVKCPRDGGDIAVRRSRKRGKPFYGCSNYPTCEFVVWDKPVLENCRECGYLGAEAKSSKTRGNYRRCISCGNEWDAPTQPEVAA